MCLYAHLPYENTEHCSTSLDHKYNLTSIETMLQNSQLIFPLAFPEEEKKKPGNITPSYPRQIYWISRAKDT